MGIYATWLAIDDGDHPLTCATWKRASRKQAEESRRMAFDYDGRYYMPSGDACDCPNKPPLIYQGSHVNPSDDDPRGGYLLACAIPNHCHPDVRFDNHDDEGAPVDYLRLSMGEDPSTYHGMEPGHATLVLGRAQVEKLRDTLTQWLDAEER